MLRRLPLLAATAILTVTASAEVPDAPAPDMAQIVAFLKSLKETQAQQIKASKVKLLQDAQTAAATPATAAMAWVDAVRLTQFGGSDNPQYKAWKDGDGSAFSDAHVQRAAQLYFRWLALTMQRSNGVPAKDLLPHVIQFTKDVATDQVLMGTFGDRIQREKELANSRNHGMRRDNTKDDELARKVHDQIIRTPVTGGPPIAALNAEDLVKPDKWETNPSNIDGIFNSIILPELRAARDPRIFEYWDMKIKKEAEAVKEKPAFEQDKFNKERYPSLLWTRANEYTPLGQPNRALLEMFKLVKTYPQHPDLANWIKQLEGALTPPAAPTSASAGTSASAQ